MSEIIWSIEKGIRADIVCCRGANLSGKTFAIRILPSGKHKGRVATEDLQSMVISAVPGTRVVLKSGAGSNWEDHTWRCIRILKGKASPSSGGAGLLTVRIPDLDLLDKHVAKHTNRDCETSYPIANRLADGTDWTFGRVGTLKSRVREIWVGHDVVEGQEVVEGQRQEFPDLHREITVYRAQSGAQEALEQELRAATETIQASRGCIRAELYVTHDMPDQFTLLTEFEPGMSGAKPTVDSLLARAPANIDLKRIA